MADSAEVKLVDVPEMGYFTTDQPNPRYDRTSFPSAASALTSLTFTHDNRGEIYVKTKTMAQGYYNDPDATAAAFTEDGWFRSVTLHSCGFMVALTLLGFLFIFV